MKRDEFIKKLHPLITHINASDNMSEETLAAINIMVEIVSKMTNEEIKALIVKSKPEHINDITDPKDPEPQNSWE